jgi:hypothetical protein
MVFEVVEESLGLGSALESVVFDESQQFCDLFVVKVANEELKGGFGLAIEGDELHVESQEGADYPL